MNERMARRQFVAAVGGAALTASVRSAEVQAKEPGKTVSPASGSATENAGARENTWLPLDGWHVEHQDNVELRQGRPEWVPEATYEDPTFDYLTTVLEHDGRLRIYSNASRDLHHRYVKSQFVRTGKEPPTAIIMHTLRKDGFMYLASRGNWASLTTKPLALFSPELQLNVLAPYGELVFQVTDLLSKPIAGYTFDDCVPQKEVDAQDAPLRFRDKPDLSDLMDQPIRLQMKFRAARIHAMRGQFHWLDALDVVLLKDGKPIDRKSLDS